VDEPAGRWCCTGSRQTNLAPCFAAGIAASGLVIAGTIRDWVAVLLGLRPGGLVSAGLAGWADLRPGIRPRSVLWHRGKPPWSTRNAWNDAAPSWEPPPTCRLWIARQRELQHAERQLRNCPWPQAPRTGCRWSWAPPEQDWLMPRNPEATRGLESRPCARPAAHAQPGGGGSVAKQQLSRPPACSWPIAETANPGSACWRSILQGRTNPAKRCRTQQRLIEELLTKKGFPASGWQGD